MTNETFHKLLNKMCGSYGIGCDKCPLNEPRKRAGVTCKEYIEDHGPAVRDIVRGWALDAASKHTVQTGQPVELPGGKVAFAREIDRGKGLDFLTIRLPSGRKLYYAQPHMGQDRFGRPSICYMGVNQITRKWERIETYGGKIAENCLCGDTLVLTPNGWKRMDLLTMRDAVWDGRQWVQHDGVIHKGTRPVIDVDGVRIFQEGLKEANQ